MSSRPWRDGRKSSAPASGGPLIPTKAVGATTQRLLATALFFLLQGVKLAASKTAAHFIFFSALDAGFLYLLPVFAIPRLNFKPKVILFQILTLIVLNYSVFISGGWLWNIIWFTFKPLLAIFGFKGFSGSQLSAYEAGLISGKYVVDILPEASARLDTIAPLCISSEKRSPVYLRLSLDNTWPSAVQLSRAELGNTSSYEHIVFGKREISRFPAEHEKSSNLYLPVSEPGAYYLDRILDDRTGLRVKILRDRIVIPPCPSVNLFSLSDDLLCQDSVFNAEIEVTGVAPLMVMVDDEWVTLGEKLVDDKVATVKHGIQKQNGVQVQVSQIKDSLGSVVEVSKQVSAKIINPPVANVLGNQRLPSTNGDVTAQFQVSGDNQDAPFSVMFRGPGGDDDIAEITVPQAGFHQFRVSSPGVYRLEGVRGIRCLGSASGQFEVFIPPPVSLGVKFDVVEEKCAGPTGVDASLRIQGSEPFKVGYKTLKGGRVVSQKVAEFNGPDGILRFRPKDVGDYRYEIAFVEDKYRRQQFSSDDAQFTTSQQITELPGAQFGSIPRTKICGSSHISIDVFVRGRGPFNLKYSVDDDKEYDVATGEATDKDTVRLDLDLPAGNHFVRLVSLTDRNNCVTQLPGTRTPDIFVQPQLPRIGWKSPGDFKSAEPVNTLMELVPENVNYPAKFVYERSYLGRKFRHETILNSLSDAITATEPGSYRLLSLDDGICGGEVDQESMINISLYERPHLEVDSGSIPQNVCQNSNTASTPALLRLFGEAPFTVIHESVDPLGKVDTKTHALKTNEMKLKLDSNVVGQYKHYLWVMDARYPEFYRPQYIQFKHEVYPLAEAVFVNKLHKVQVCENTALSQPMNIALKGKAPFQLTFQVDKETKIVEIEKAAKVDLRQYLQPFTENGTKKVRIIGVTDAHGCNSDAKSQLSLNNEMEIKVLPQPKLPVPSKLDYCIGEKISFSVSSLSSSSNSHKPQVEYLWRSKRQSSTISDKTRMFEKYASQPGNLTVLSIADTNGCRNVLQEPQTVARVHALPKSKITEQPHFSIYQGDQISLGFAFEGEAPFSFVYTRSVDGKVKERKEVKNVLEHEYNIIVEEGGEYEIVELRDKFCRSGR